MPVSVAIPLKNSGPSAGSSANLNFIETYTLTMVAGDGRGFPRGISTPLVNELVIGIPDKDHFNASSPMNDAQFATYVTNPNLPALLNVLFLAPVNRTQNFSIFAHEAFHNANTTPVPLDNVTLNDDVSDNPTAFNDLLM